MHRKSSRLLCGIALTTFIATLGGRAELIHQWSFSETSGTTIQDSVGSADAQIVVLGGGGGYQRDGRRLRLDGGDRSTADYVELPANIFDSLTDVSFEIWAVPHSFPSWGRVFCIGPGDGGDVNQQLLRVAFSRGDNGDQQKYGVYGIEPSVEPNQLTPVDREYHYVITWDADGAGGDGLLSVYRDGELIGTQDTGSITIQTLANLSDTTFWLGRTHFPADGTANASYNEVRVYDDVLDPDTIRNHALRGVEDTLGLLHRWSFSETSGTTLNDFVGTSPGQIVSPDGVPDHQLGGGQVTLDGGARGTADFVQFDTRRLDGLTDTTLEVWATPHAGLNWSRVIDIGDGETTTPEDSFLLSFTRGGDINAQRFEYQPAGGTADTQLPTPLDEEYHYAITWDSTAGRVNWYRDGVYVDGFDAGSTTLADVQDEVIWLGRSHWAADATANASFNEFRIYDRALDEQEIALHAEQGPDNISFPPAVAVDDEATLNLGGAVSVDVLANDTAWRLNPATLNVIAGPSDGTANVQSNGNVLYQHTGTTAGSDQFTYEVTDTISGETVSANVNITVSGDLRVAATTLNMPPEPPEVGYATVDAFPGLEFEDTLGVRHHPAIDTQLFVILRRGRVERIGDVTAAVPQSTTFLDISDRIAFDDSNLGELGLQSIALHPDFASNGYIYAYYTAPRPAGRYYNLLSRFEVERDAQNQFDPLNPVIDESTELILFQLYDNEFNHNGGDLHFGPDGYLYIGMGDEGGQRDPNNNSQTITKELYSGILRIDVDKRPGNLEPNPFANPDPGSEIPTDGFGDAYYSIPADNPFVGATSFNGVAVNPSDVREEFWAVGFRHIWRMGFDEETGELWAGDVGQGNREEVNLIEKGLNYGWKYREGTVATVGVGAPPANWTDFNPVDPTWEYLHNGQPNFNGFSVTGGRVYRGTSLPEDVQGAYIFADFVTGHIWALTRDDSSTNVVRLTGDDGIAAIGTDPSNGDILLCDYSENSVKRLVYTDVAGDDFPQLLSQTGAFADTETLTPNPGVVAYEPKLPFWSDHAIKTRWFAVPDLVGLFGFNEHGNWSLPVDAVWVKHFDLELERGNPSTKQRIETRFLVKSATDVYGVSYKWNAEQTDAILVPAAGDSWVMDILDGGSVVSQLVEIPSRSACMSCHTEVGGYALSFYTAQLNCDGPFGGGGNQLLRFNEAGYLSDGPDSVAGLPRHATADDPSVTLESRVRSYLDVNCVQCHQPGGSAPSTWDARSELRLDQTGLLLGVPDRPGSDPENLLVVPGDTTHSVLLQRIAAGNGFSRMPPIASHVLDQESIDLVTAWIQEELPGRQTYEQWQVTEFGSSNHPDAARHLDPDLDDQSNEYEFLNRTDPNVPNDPWTIALDVESDTSTVGFQRLRNRGYLIEVSDNLFDWKLWDVVGNDLWFGPDDVWQEISGPASTSERTEFFRVQIVEP